ncbi:MAG: glycosyl hydrolase [Armatimonadota bacterium]
MAKPTVPNSTCRRYLGIAATGLGGLWLGDGSTMSAHASSAASPLDALYSRFQDPDREYSVRPYWFWNGKLEAEEIERQIRQMIGQGVYGVYVHNRDGLQTPYLSEEWWQAVGAALKVSRDLGFSLCMVDEFEWPTGDARDYWLPGPNKSRVVAANPEYHMKRLRPVETRVHGPQRIDIYLPKQTALVVVGKRLASNRIDGSTLRTLEFDRSASALPWDVPPGDWLVTTYSLELTQAGGSSVDLLNRNAIREFIEIYYEEFYRRFPEHFGNALPATLSDHEGFYGSACAWTPALFEAFRHLKGYDLEPLLPGLSYDIGKTSEKLRCDYLDVISDLYVDSFFKQINDWCAAHKIEYSAHMWEESLFFGPAYQGDYYRIFRSMANPSCDSIEEWGRQSVWLKELASIADFEGQRLICENQGLQGDDSYLSPEKMRSVSNSLGAWNVGEFIPHAFNYDLERTNFPPDWFRGQPFLPWFRPYADLIRRISFMNRDSFEVADLLLYYPQVSVFGQSGTVLGMQGRRGMMEILPDSAWPEDAVLTNSQFALLKLRLSEERLDYKVADDSYLADSRVEGNTLAISTSRFRALVLPPMSMIRRRTAERVAEFYRAGGIVIAMDRLPSISVEEGRDDAHLEELWESIFDSAPALEPVTMRSNAAGGRAYFTRGSVGNAVDLVRSILDHDVDVVSGPADHLHVLHKKKDGIDFYWVVNDSASPRTNLLRFRASGRPERWDGPTGKRMPVFYQTEGAQTVVRVAFGPWDAAYIVFDPSGSAQPLALQATNLDEFAIERASAGEVVVRGRSVVGKGPAFVELGGNGKTWRGDYRAPSMASVEITGDWTVTVESPAISLPYADVRDDPDDRGQRERWYAEEPGTREWSRLWLSPLNCSIRKWNLIGPFPNPGDRGLEESFPPEREIDLQAAYEGDGGREIRWVTIDNDQERLDVASVDWSWATLKDHDARYDPCANIIDYGELLRMAAAPTGTVYAQTNVYSPDAQDATILLATSSPHAVWLNGHQVHSRWVRPIFYALHDGFAYRIPVRLIAG